MRVYKIYAVILLCMLAIQTVQAQEPGPRNDKKKAEQALEKARDFTLKTHDGKSLTLSKLRGKRGVVLVFFATWCPHCMTEIPHIKRFVENSKDQKVLVYGVNIKQPDHVVDKFVKSKAVNYRILLDKEGKVSIAYGITGIPAVIGIDGNGVIKYKGHQIPEDEEAFIKLLNAPLADKQPKKSVEKVL